MWQYMTVILTSFRQQALQFAVLPAVHPAACGIHASCQLVTPNQQLVARQAACASLCSTCNSMRRIHGYPTGSQGFNRQAVVLHAVDCSTGQTHGYLTGSTASSGRPWSFMQHASSIGGSPRAPSYRPWSFMQCIQQHAMAAKGLLLLWEPWHQAMKFPAVISVQTPLCTACRVGCSCGCGVQSSILSTCQQLFQTHLLSSPGLSQPRNMSGRMDAVMSSRHSGYPVSSPSLHQGRWDSGLGPWCTSFCK